MNQPGGSPHKPEIRTGVGLAAPGVFRLFAECDVAMTDFTFYDSPTMPSREDLQGWLGELLLVDHQRRCEACEHRANA